MSGLNLRLAAAILLQVAPALADGPGGGLDLSGDAGFDSDSIASVDNQSRRWLSYPGGRLCLNPASARHFDLLPMGADLALDIGGYVGNGVLRLGRVVDVRLGGAGQGNATAGLSVSRAVTWFPYKIGYSAAFEGGAGIAGADFFLDTEGTLIRVLELSGCRGKDLWLGGSAGSAGGSVAWDEQAGCIVAAGSNYYYALRFASISGDSMVPGEVAVRPVINGTNWNVSIPVAAELSGFAVGFGFAEVSEGRERAVLRARTAVAVPVRDLLAAAKAKMDGFLRKVAKPVRWGVDGVESYGVTAERHRKEYYTAWTLLYQSIMNVFPENPGYPYPQMSVGKSSLWAEGEKRCPATCGWESFMGLQWLSFIEPEFAWSAYEGIMSLVDEKGQLGGESLPSRKAQTAWVLYQRQPDRNKLKSVYPAIRRYLLWREQNLRWLYGNRNIEEERDIEFVVSWLVDVGFAVKIATVLGNEADIEFWRGKVAPMVERMREWFFCDPAKVHQFYFVNEKKHNARDRTSDRPIMTLTALCLKYLPADMVERLKALFLEIHDPARPNDGFGYTKYADNNLDAYGLLDHGVPGAQEFMLALLRDSIRGGEFGETLEVNKKGELMAAGVKPSLFNALNVIEFTWLLNGVRYEGSRLE